MKTIQLQTAEDKILNKIEILEEELKECKGYIEAQESDECMERMSRNSFSFLNSLKQAGQFIDQTENRIKEIEKEVAELESELAEIQKD